MSCKAWCTAALNLIPEHTTALYDAMQNNRLDKAQKLFYEQLGLLRFIVGAGIPRVIQAGLELLSDNGGMLRNPLKPLAAPERKVLERLLREM